MTCYVCSGGTLEDAPSNSTFEVCKDHLIVPVKCDHVVGYISLFDETIEPIRRSNSDSDILGMKLNYCPDCGEKL